MVALVRAIHSRFYPLGRQVARFDLQLTYFSKWAEFPILVLLTIFAYRLPIGLSNDGNVSLPSTN